MGIVSIVLILLIVLPLIATATAPGRRMLEWSIHPSTPASDALVRFGAGLLLFLALGGGFLIALLLGY